jgi:mannosyltransferase
VHELAVEASGGNSVRGSSRGPALAVVVTSLLGLGIALVGIGNPSFWFDEAASVSASRRSLPDLFGMLHHIDLVHGLYYVVLHAWVSAFGASEVALRLPSAIALTAAIAGTVLLADRVANRCTAWAAGFAAALLPGLAWAGNEGREWALVTACVTWATYVLILALEDVSRRLWVGYCALMLVALGLSVLSILMLAVHVWLASRYGKTRVALAISAGLSLAVSPLLIATYTQRTQVAWIHFTPARLAGEVAINQLFLEEQNRNYLLAPVAGLLLATLFAVVAVAGLRNGGRAAGLGAVWVVAPTFLLVLPSIVGVEMYQARYLTYVAPGACVLIGAGVDALAVRWPSSATWRAALIVTVVGAVGVAAIPLAAQRDVSAKSGDNYRSLAAEARGAAEVYYGDASARGIAIAYPQDFLGVRDVLLQETPGASNSLFGVDSATSSGHPGGIVVTYVDRLRLDRHLPGTNSFLQARGCTELGRYVASRWVAIRYRCS